MRKDKGLNSDLDRLPQLTWLLFLKFIDDLEQEDEAKAALGGQRHRPLIPAPYRWRDWAGRADGITGDALISFINNDEAVRPDGTRGPGLFAALRTLQGIAGGDRRDVVARVFRGTANRMQSGYLLKDLVDRLNDVHFTSSDDLHTLGRIYEEMLREMRDAAGDAGEFYTPRPLIRLIVELVRPRIGEVIFDPACGTGGFLVEALEHLKSQAKTVADVRTIQTRSIRGQEAKALPYLLCEMNLLLHRLDHPDVQYGNSLAINLAEVGDDSRVDVILTNPPFGGEEERGIAQGFPADMQTRETALLFLQLIMRRLRRPGASASKGGRAAVIVPNSTLFADGVAARIKHQLLREFNLHTIVRLPYGVFEPYTDIPTNILFFDRRGPTKNVWFYTHPLPAARRKRKQPKYTKAEPLEFAEFAPLLEWWNDRKETDQAWSVPVEKLIKSDVDGRVEAVNLDISHPASATQVGDTRASSALLQDIRSKTDFVLSSIERLASAETVSEEQLRESVDACVAAHQEISASADALQESFLEELFRPVQDQLVPLGSVLKKVGRRVVIQPGRKYALAGVYGKGRGLIFRNTFEAHETAYSEMYELRESDVVFSKLKVWEGAVTVVPKEGHGRLVSSEFPTYEIDRSQVLPEYLDVWFKRPPLWRELFKRVRGIAGRKIRVTPSTFESVSLPRPSIEVQAELVRAARLRLLRLQGIAAVLNRRSSKSF